MEWILGWLVNWCYLIQGLIGVVSLNLWRPPLAIWMAGYLAKWRYYNKKRS